MNNSKGGGVVVLVACLIIVSIQVLPFVIHVSSFEKFSTRC